MPDRPRNGRRNRWRCARMGPTRHGRRGIGPSRSAGSFRAGSAARRSPHRRRRSPAGGALRPRRSRCRPRSPPDPSSRPSRSPPDRGCRPRERRCTYPADEPPGSRPRRAAGSEKARGRAMPEGAAGGPPRRSPCGRTPRPGRAVRPYFAPVISLGASTPLARSTSVTKTSSNGGRCSSASSRSSPRS